MKKPSRKKYFSMIFVPDQERDPKSISMSYFQGRILFLVLIVFGFHCILGIINYFRIQNLKNVNQILLDENQVLVTKNSKIERIYQEFQRIKEIDEKIRKAFGHSLGLAEESIESLKNMKIPLEYTQTVSPLMESSDLTVEIDPRKIQKNHYFLTESEAYFYDPGYLPTLLPVGGYLTTHFHQGGWFLGRSHWGIDIAARKGSPIRAAGSGIVIMADWTPDFGNIVVVSHGNGFFTYYGHAMRLLVDQGFHVKKGDAIALLGSSGSSSAPHLHFEIWKNGKPIDPEQFLFTIQKKKEES